MRALSQPSPQKWQKYSLLVDFDLVKQAYLQERIHRFAWADRNTVLQMLRVDVAQFGGKQFIVVKLVPAHLGHQLPNHRIYSPADLGSLEAAFAASASEFIEVWFCRTFVNPTGLNGSGRLVIDERAGPGGHSIEQVWNCSPRLLQHFDANFAFPYVRATSVGWGWRPVIQDLFIPPGLDLSAEELSTDFFRTQGMLLAKRAPLERLQRFVEECGLSVMSFEFKVEADRLHIIDWDTACDAVVLSRWRAAQESSVP